MLLDSLVNVILRSTEIENIFLKFFEGNAGNLLIIYTYYLLFVAHFFIIIIIQNTSLVILVYLVRIGELFKSYLSPWIAYHRRTFLNDIESWRKKERDLFMYGYFFAQMMAIFLITILFA